MHGNGEIYLRDKKLALFKSSPPPPLATKEQARYTDYKQICSEHLCVATPS